MFKIRCWVTWLSGEGCSLLLRLCLDATVSGGDECRVLKWQKAEG